MTPKAGRVRPLLNIGAMAYLYVIKFYYTQIR